MMPFALACNLPIAALVDACGARRLFGQSTRSAYRNIVASIRPDSDHADQHTYPLDIWHFLGYTALVTAVVTGLLFVWLAALPGLAAAVGAASTGLVTCVLLVNSVLLGGFTPRLYQLLWKRSRLLLDAGWTATVSIVVGVNAVAFYG